MIATLALVELVSDAQLIVPQLVIFCLGEIYKVLVNLLPEQVLMEKVGGTEGYL